MKILSRDQIRVADAYTIKEEPISSYDLMERAAAKCYLRLKTFIPKKKKINIFCGKGNNGGDGLVLARLFLKENYQLKVFILEHIDNGSEDFEKNLKLLKQLNSEIIFSLTEGNYFPIINKTEIIIDALWGTGLTRPLEGLAKKIVLKINETQAQVFSVDIPSGIFCDFINNDSAKIKAKRTFSFQVPKLAFFIPENQEYIGEWEIIDIGLNKQFIQKQESHFAMIEKKDVYLKPRNKFDHKGIFGHALLIAGSYGKIGASVLSGKACLRSGVGLLTIYAPECGYTVIQTVLPEAMVISDLNEKIISYLPEIKGFNAIGIGPGIGTENDTCNVLNQLLSDCQKPMVLDADAINILSLHPELIKKLPINTILTPHIGEFDRLVGKSDNHLERLEKAKTFAKNNNCILILKGHYTAVINKNGDVSFNSTGNAGMATGGSGDVLTGIILSFLSQGFQSIDAAKSAVYIHGLAGDISAKKFTQQSMISGDIIDNLGEAFKYFQEI